MAVIDKKYHRLLKTILKNGRWYDDPNRKKDIICEKYNIKKSTFYNIKKENYPFIKDLDIEINNLIGNLKNNGKSKYKGISFNKNCNKWQLEFNKKYIGLFTTEEEAIIKLKKLDSESRINK